MRSDRILLAHGSGGTMMRELIEDVFMHGFADDILARGDDAATLEVPAGRIAMSTDTYVVSPLFFPGGDIGRLAVCGTVTDIATAGATPLYLSVGFILEEGFMVEDLRKILVSMHDAAAEAG
ncbi:MAG: AIR synthase related protein, partial [Coriobacteriia bacterium]|nr:AIR synthase related protein [Coriobacteriia bacterium]